jgi:hypothetical protein
MAHLVYAHCLLSGIGIEANMRRAADQGFLSAQLRCATLFRQGLYIERNLLLSTDYLKAAADQGSTEAQIEFASFLVWGDGIPKDVRESERYLRLAVDERNEKGQMRLGIYLMSGVFGRFDFDESRQLFSQASRSHRFAVILRDSLSNFDCELKSPSDFSSNGNIFSILRSSIDESIPMIRLLNLNLNLNLCPNIENPVNIVDVWQQFAGCCLEYLIDLSHSESDILRSWPTDLLSVDSVTDMIPFIFRIYTVNWSLYDNKNYSLYNNVNHFLRCFPIGMICKFMKELKGLLHYIYLLQSSIEYDSHIHPLSTEIVVYRGFKSGGSKLIPLYHSMIGEVIVWSSFTSTSMKQESVIENYIAVEDSILFEILLHRGDAAACIWDD